MSRIALKTPLRAFLSALVVGPALLLTFGAPARAAELNIYSHRQPFLIQPFLDAYTEKTGTKIDQCAFSFQPSHLDLPVLFCCSSA